MLTAEQMLAAQKANVETLFGLTTKAFEGVEKLVELNVTASKAALTEAAGTSQALLTVKDAQELLALQAALFQPLAEKTAAYSCHLYDIAAGTGAEFGRTFEAVADRHVVRSGLADHAAGLHRIDSLVSARGIHGGGGRSVPSPCRNRSHRHRPRDHHRPARRRDCPGWEHH